jgi:hypothetical protein
VFSDAILEAHVALRLTTLARHTALADRARAAGAIRERLAPLHHEGTVLCAEHRGRTVGVLAWRHDPDPWCGVPVSSVALDYDPGWTGAEAWLANVLDRELPRMDADLELLLDASYRAAHRALCARGVRVDSLQLLGKPREALDRLRADRAIAPLPSGMAIEPLTAEHVDDVITLHRVVFTAEPQYCWFGADERWLRRRRDTLHAELDHEGGHYVVVHRGRVLGHLGARVREDPCFGRTAGMILVLARELRGRGLLRALYAHLLESMIAQGATAFRGGTCQPPVLRLGLVMGRRLLHLVMRRGAFFPETHFAPYLPP